MLLKKIISGGQTGADQAALVAAKKFGGLETGGWMPKGFRTLEGPCPSFAEEFGMWEHTQPGYRPRTFQNVWKAQGTMRFATNWQSAGEKCTLKAIQLYQRPYLDIGVPSEGFWPKGALQAVTADQAAKWLVENRVETLNVAGNSEKTSPGIARFVERYLTQVFQLLATGVSN